MSSRNRSRSKSPHDRREHGRERRKEHKEEEKKESNPLPHGAQPLSDSNYFLRNAEFRSWLKDEKGKYFDELSGEKSRSKFVKAWNRGKLPKSYYAGEDIASKPAASQTAYRWSFASKRNRAEEAALEAARNAVGAATHSTDPDGASNSMGASPVPGPRAGPSRVLGPALPSAGDRILIREAQEMAQAAERSYGRKRAREEDKERVEELVGPKERGREGMLEKKKVRRETDKAARDAKDDTFGEYDESTLMGGGDSFQARIAQRDAARKRFEEKRSSGRDEKDQTIRERQDSFRAKEKATMDMFKQMAKERFGG